MADRADWEAATRHQRQLAVAADAELRRRHPGQPWPPLRSAEPEPATEAQRDDLTLTPDSRPGETDQWINDLAARHREFADKLADRQSLMIPAEDPDYADLGPAFPPWPDPDGARSCSRPSPRSRRPRGSWNVRQPRRRPGSRRLTGIRYMQGPVIREATTRAHMPKRVRRRVNTHKAHRGADLQNRSKATTR